MTSNSARLQQVLREFQPWAKAMSWNAFRKDADACPLIAFAYVTVAAAVCAGAAALLVFLMDGMRWLFGYTLVFVFLTTWRVGHNWFYERPLPLPPMGAALAAFHRDFDNRPWWTDAEYTTQRYLDMDALARFAKRTDLEHLEWPVYGARALESAKRETLHNRNT
jgi:hypothetical protein